MVSSVLLNIVTLIVLMEEARVVAIWRYFGIVQFLVIVSNSLHVLWGINDLWIVWRVVIRVSESDGSVDALVLVVKLVPLSTILLWVGVGYVGVSQTKIHFKSLSGSHVGHGESLLASINLNIGISLKKNSIIGSVLLLNKLLLLLLNGVFESDGADLAK